MNKAGIVLLLLLFLPVGAMAEGQSRIGVGGNYWTTIDDIDVDDIDESGFSFYGSYQHWMGLIGLEADLEIHPDKYGETAFDPQAWVLVGTAIYAGAGIGIEYRDGDFAEQPFFALRAGLNLELLPSIYWDIYGMYRFNDKAELDNDRTDIDTDTVFLGTAVRFGF